MNGQPVRLDVTMRLEDQRLVLRYSLSSRTNSDLLVFNALYAVESGGVAVDPNRVYMLLDDDVLTLAKAVIEIPRGVQVEIPDVPYATKLSPGMNLQEDIRIELPVQYYNPHDLVTTEATIPCRAVRFRLGYAPVSKIDPAPEPVRVGQRSYFRVKYRAALKSQRLVETEPFAIPVSVHRRP